MNDKQKGGAKMKKYAMLICVIVLLFSVVGCSDTRGEGSASSSGNYELSIENTNVSSSENEELIIDYTDASLLENALNNGEYVSGCIVQFYVNNYKPDSALGINCWAGEHLNFISENELDVQAGDTIIGRIIDEPTNIYGSWEIPYEVIEIIPGTEADNENDVVENEPTGETAPETESNEEMTESEEEPIVEEEEEIISEENEEEAIPEVETEESSSEYEKAYKRELSGYSIYIMFDEDTNDVVSFLTNDSYVMTGSYSGSFSSGVTISWDDGWNEEFTHAGGNSAILIDGNGFEWGYVICDVGDAQDVLDRLN